MKNYYVIPDIHGCNHLLEKALAYIYSKNPDGGKIIFLGDYIDRGPDNRAVLETVMNPPSEWEFICLKGNHEDMFVSDYMEFARFYDQKVAAEFNNRIVASYDILHSAIPLEVIQWINQLKLFHIEDQNVFAHAFYNDKLAPDDQDERECLWVRMLDHEIYQNDIQGLFLTHGHTPRAHGPVWSGNRINLDAGAVYYGTLYVGEYAPGEKGPVHIHSFS